MEVLDARLRIFAMIFTTISETKKGEVLAFEYFPDVGTLVTLGGVEKGRIEGIDFNRALLKVWVGKKPAQEDLKHNLLGNK